MSNINNLIASLTESQKPVKPFRVLGIDLGTTNSTVAEFTWVTGSAPKLRCLEIDQETLAQGRATHILVPSIIALLGDSVFVGEGAKRLRSETVTHKLELYKNIFWECKNHMGLTRTYHKAPEGYRSAKDIASKILSFLLKSALEDAEIPVIRTVITVPASFQAAQREDTLIAAQFAGIDVKGGDLLDEPMAAFLDYLYSHGADCLELGKKSKNLLVFDFGGGTCDVAVFRLNNSTKSNSPGNLEVAPLAVSRYHRLGGGDIDKAIIHEVILPQLICQNNLGPFELGFEEKSKFIEPAFLSLAENLKIGLCREMVNLRSFKNNNVNKKEIIKTQPGVYSCKLRDGRELKIQEPTLSVSQFIKLLEPFLDREFLFARETEYTMTASIFGPITDCINRSGLPSVKIDFCLMVGGSSLIPQVQDAVELFFQKGKVINFADAEATQVAVARGAACQSLALALTGKGLIQTVAGDSISVLTSSGPVPLIQKGTNLPFPSDGSWKEIETLVVPESSKSKPLQIRIELLNSDNKILASCPGSIKPPVRRGDKLIFRYKLDENQNFHFDLMLANRKDDSVIKESLKNPLTNVVNPNSKREEIDQIEEDIRNKTISADDIRNKTIHLSNLYSDLNQHEKALGILQALLASKGPDDSVLNLMGTICGRMGDLQREERYYLESVKKDNDTSGLFNLALSKKKQGKLDEALSLIKKANSISKKAPYLTLQAMIVDALGKAEEKAALISEAFRIYDPVSTLDDWQLGWYFTAAQLSGDKIKKSEAEAEQRSRYDTISNIQATGLLPELRH